MNYIYRNDTPHTILYRGYYWLPGDEIDTPYPVPSSLGLTCIQQGSSPDPVLFHDDVAVPAGGDAEVFLDAPALSHRISLDIQCMTPDSGVACRFNHRDNKPIPIDARGFAQVLVWELCSCLFFENSTDTEAIISVTAIETGC